MTQDEVKQLRTGDLVLFCTTKDGRVSNHRAQIDMTTETGRFLRVQWLTAPKCYDVIDYRSPVWSSMAKL